MCPLELSATPDASPRYMLCGRRTGLGTESKAMVGTGCCASAGGAASSRRPSSARFIKFLPKGLLLLLAARMLVMGGVGVHCGTRAAVRRSAHGASDELAL